MRNTIGYRYLLISSLRYSNSKNGEERSGRANGKGLLRVLRFNWLF